MHRVVLEWFRSRTPFKIRAGEEIKIWNRQVGTSGRECVFAFQDIYIYLYIHVQAAHTVTCQSDSYHRNVFEV